MEFSVTDQFRNYQADSAELLLKQREQRWFVVSLDYALAHVASLGATKEELSGAKRLIQSLINLPDTPVERPSFPVRELTTFEQQESPKPPKT